MANTYCSSTGSSITESEPGWLGIPHLSLIIDDDNVEALKGFLQQKPDCPGWRVNHYEHNWYSGWGPVDYAIGTGSLNVFCELLTLEEAMTAAAHPYRLHEACRRGRLDMVRRLLNSSADVQDSIKRIDKFGATPLLAATGIRGYPGSEAVMHLLLDAGANPLQDIYTAGRPRDGSDEFVEESRRQQGIDLPFLVTNALTAAMEFATPALIERLFHAGVDLCAGGSYRIEGWPDEIFIHVTPLHLACSESSVERVQALLRLGGSNAPRMVAQRDSMGRTALHWAVLGNLNEPYVGQDPGQLHDRILLQRKKCIQALCAHGREAATVNAQDRDGKTAMHLAVESCFPEVVICLLEQGANPNLIDSAGRTALMALAMSNNFTEMHKHVIDTLTKAMVNNLGAGDDHGNTALHLACSHYERLWIARLLIERGAPCHLTNGSGELPLHKAVALWPPSYTFARFDMFRGALQSQDQFISLLLDKTRGVCGG
ncbi:Ankyrin-2 [Neopestalotiopsis sp. 37M]|nr:Ankyrin-2 [Neopestalotiopsis sp. 37M]